MPKAITTKLKRELLSSAHVFASAVREVFETAVLNEVAGGKLTSVQLKLLYLATRADGHTIGDAAALLGVSNAAASKTVEKLVRRKLIRRTKTWEDRRASRISATAAGRLLVEEYEVARHKMAAAFFNQLSAQELRKTSELLDRLAVAILSHGAKPDEFCLQCDVYYRENCRFEALSRRKCFYKRSRRNRQASPAPDHDET